MIRPQLLDVFCGAGGSAKGYHDAGFDVLGVDSAPQPNYPYPFVQADALDYIRRYGYAFDVIHASPPCRDHTPLTSVAGTDGTAWLLPATRALLDWAGKPYVIENVPGAPIRRDITLCGGMFGLRVYRHRWFEANWPMSAPTHPPHLVKTATKQRMLRWEQGWNISVTGDGPGSSIASIAMGIDWMIGNELSQAIPPAYTEHIGRQLLAQIGH